MLDTPNYTFNRSARFSANHLAEYLCTKDAGQRETVIRKAKFPRKPATIAYQQVTPTFRRFWAKGTGDTAALDDLDARLLATAKREVGYTRDEALRCSNAIAAFKAAHASVKWGKAEFLPGPQDVTFKISQVAVNVRFDPPIIERGPDGQVFAGGCVLLLSGSDDARKNIEERRKYVAAIAHWALESTSSNLPTLARLCMSFDVFGEEAVKAPTATDRLRKTMEASCREAYDGWARVEPPAGYDGPDWR